MIAFVIQCTVLRSFELNHHQIREIYSVCGRVTFSPIVITTWRLFAHSHSFCVARQRIVHHNAASTQTARDSNNESRIGFRAKMIYTICCICSTHCWWCANHLLMIYSSIKTTVLTLSVAKETILAVVCRHENGNEIKIKSLDILIRFLCVFSAHW